MSACPHGLCDGSGLTYAHPEPMAGPGWTEASVCSCLGQGAAPATPAPVCGLCRGVGRYQPLGAQEVVRCPCCAARAANASEPAECLHCKRPADAVNHVPGHIFVGFGIGWQPCVYCAGSRKVTP